MVTLSTQNNKLLAFLKLIRVENLLMIALTQLLLRYFVLGKILNEHGVQLELDTTLFYLVVLSTVLIAAAGYIINDYFDVKTDLINHPDTVVVDRVIKRRVAIILHFTFTIIGVLIGMYAALKTGYLRLAVFHFAAAILLWFYSTHLKKTLLFGNIAVSLLTAAVAFMPFVYEMGVMRQLYPGFIHEYRYAVLACLKITFIFSLFAFITSMAREIIKDIEDYRGDLETGGKTMPIVWGQRSAKICAFFLLIITGLLLMFVVYNTMRFERKFFSVDLAYIVFLLIVPLVMLSVYTVKADEPSSFKMACLFVKLIMFLGLSYSFIFYYS
jgi:4-hydroxybenzoate polyprenyltransferase